MTIVPDLLELSLLTESKAAHTKGQPSGWSEVSDETSSFCGKVRGSDAGDKVPPRAAAREGRHDRGVCGAVCADKALSRKTEAPGPVLAHFMHLALLWEFQEMKSQVSGGRLRHRDLW